MKEVDPRALFRLSVLGPLVSRERLERGELKQIVNELAQHEYAMPGTGRRQLSAKTLESWFYAWRRHGLAGLTPKTRADRGRSKLAPTVQEAILRAKRENPRRSIRQSDPAFAGSGRHGGVRQPVALGDPPPAAGARPVACDRRGGGFPGTPQLRGRARGRDLVRRCPARTGAAHRRAPGS